MRLSLRLMGLDVLDLCIETDSAESCGDEYGESTTYPIGFQVNGEDFAVPDRGVE